MSVDGATGVFIINFAKMELYVEESKTRANIRYVSEQKSVFDSAANEHSSIDRECPEDSHLTFCTNQSGELVPVFLPLAPVGISGILEILVIRGRNFRLSNGLVFPRISYIPNFSLNFNVSTSSPFVEFILDGRTNDVTKTRTPTCKEGGETPVWNHCISMDTHFDDKTLTIKIFEEAVLGNRLVGSSRVSMPILITYLCRRKSRMPKSMTTSRYQQKVGYLGKDANKELEGLRTWFTLGRDGPGSSGDLLLHARFKPLSGAKVMQRPPQKPKEDTPLRSLSFGSSTSGTLRLSDPRPTYATGTLSSIWGSGSTYEAVIEAEGHDDRVIFGKPLRIACRQSDTRFPAPFSECIDYIREHGVKEVGIFRLSGKKSLIDNSVKQYNLGVKVRLVNSFQASGILKQYFRDLPDPLLPCTLYTDLIKLAKKAKKNLGASTFEEYHSKQKHPAMTMNSIAADSMITVSGIANAYASLVASIQEPNREILLELLSLLHEISTHSEENKMRPSNLAIVWAPNLLREKISNSTATLKNMEAEIVCIEHLIQYYPLINSAVPSCIDEINAKICEEKSKNENFSGTEAIKNPETVVCRQIEFKTLGEGFLEKTGERSSAFKHRYFRLLSRTASSYPPLLIYYDKPHGTILGTIELVPGFVKVRSVHNRSKDCTFTIARPKRTFTMRAPNAGTRDTWVKTLNKCMADHESQIRSVEIQARHSSISRLRQGSVLQNGRINGNESAKHPKSGPKAQAKTMISSKPNVPSRAKRKTKSFMSLQKELSELKEDNVKTDPASKAQLAHLGKRNDEREDEIRSTDFAKDVKATFDKSDCDDSELPPVMPIKKLMIAGPPPPKMPAGNRATMESGPMMAPPVMPLKVVAKQGTLKTNSKLARTSNGKLYHNLKEEDRSITNDPSLLNIPGGHTKETSRKCANAKHEAKASADKFKE